MEIMAQRKLHWNPLTLYSQKNVRHAEKCPLELTRNEPNDKSN
jgi:hypothetical protein